MTASALTDCLAPTLTNLNSRRVHGRRTNTGEEVFSSSTTTSSRRIKIVYFHTLLSVLLLKHRYFTCNDSLDVVGTQALITKKWMLEEFNFDDFSRLLIAASDPRRTAIDHDRFVDSILIAASNCGGVGTSSSSIGETNGIAVGSSSFITSITISSIMRRVVDYLRGYHRQWFLADDTQPAKVMGKACSMERVFVVIFGVVDGMATIRVRVFVVGFIVGVGVGVDLLPASLLPCWFPRPRFPSSRFVLRF